MMGLRSYWRYLSVMVAAAISLLASQSSAETILSLTQSTYDANDRPVCSVVRMNLASSGTDACTPDVPTGSNPYDRVTRTVYDADGSIVEIKRGVGTADAQLYATYTYTQNGLKAAEADANGNVTRLNYDKFDRLQYLYYPSPSVTHNTQVCAATAETWCGSTQPYTNRIADSSAAPMLGTASTTDFESFGYDANDNKTSWRRRNGSSHNYTYDLLNREWYDNIPGTTADVFTSYDLLGRVCSMSFTDLGAIAGDCTAIYDGTAAAGIFNKYDKANRLLATRDANGQAVAYAYNQADKRTSMTFPDSVVQAYQYNAGNMLTWSGVNATTIGITPSYDTKGRLVSLARSNGVSSSIGYDDLNRILSFGQNVVTGADVTWNFVYNPASQIISLSPGTSAYDYAETASITDGRTYDGLNRDTGIVAVSGGYDANGNLTSEGTASGQRNFTYDMDNRLLTVTTVGGSNVTVTYDPMGRLSSYQVGSGNPTQFLYDGVNLVAEYQGGVIKKRYFHSLGDDQPFLEFTNAGVTAADGKFLLANYQGSIIALADSSGTVTTANTFKYGPYGEPMGDTWTGERFRYTGQIALPEAQVYYYKARVYDPKYGRFLQTDPIRSKDDLDLYAYVGGDPVNHVDSTGLSPKTKILEEILGKPIKLVLRKEIEKIGQKAVKQAWREEKRLVETTGKGTREWTDAQKKELLKNGQVKGFDGHHINDKGNYPNLAGDPNNIAFLSVAEHRGKGGIHAINGGTRGTTSGALLDRTAGGRLPGAKMISSGLAETLVAAGVGLEAADYLDPLSAATDPEFFDKWRALKDVQVE